MRESQTKEGARRPSREEIETLCVLHAIGDRGCTLEELAERLGLSADLAPALDAAVAPMLISGHVATAGDRFAITPAGRSWAESRLAGFGVT